MNPAMREGDRFHRIQPEHPVFCDGGGSGIALSIQQTGSFARTRPEDFEEMTCLSPVQFQKIARFGIGEPVITESCHIFSLSAKKIKKNQKNCKTL